MQTLIDLFASPSQADAATLFDDGRDKWVGLISAVGLCALLAGDLISLL